MGWDAALDRKLAVPIVPEASPVLDDVWRSHRRRGPRTRTLKEPEGDPEEMHILMKLADNRIRLERLKREIDELTEIDDSDDLMAELDYVNATVSLGLLEIMGELSEIESSEEVLEEATA